jgi:hypothetical protein
VKKCYERVISWAIEERKAAARVGKTAARSSTPPSVEWRTFDSIIVDLQMARERAVRKALK